MAETVASGKEREKKQKIDALFAGKSITDEEEKKESSDSEDDEESLKFQLV